MSSSATRRLIDAAAKLDPADRALLNLWVNRGLDDARLTGLTGMSLETLHARRQRIVVRLAADLGLPEPDVRDALTEITPRDGGAAPAPGKAPANGAGPLPAAANGAAPAPQPASAEAPEAASAEAPEAALAPDAAPAPGTAETPPRRRRGWWLGLAALAVAVIAAVVVVISANGPTSSGAHHPAATRTTPTTAAPAPTVPTPVHPIAAPAPVPFAGLPGGLLHATGSVKLFGPVKHLRLNLTVRGLPRAHAGHYEVWLYNSVLDSRPIARLRNGRHRLTAQLPRDARHYRWIDISFQPVGVVNHSGESELRASNPAHTTMARLRKRSSRTRHRLRQATAVAVTGSTKPSAKRGARRRAARPATHARPARRGRHHRTRRATHGSRKAKTSK